MPQRGADAGMKPAGPPSSEPNKATPSALPVWRMALSTPEATPEYCLVDAPQQRRGQWRNEQTRAAAKRDELHA